jgi:hypothetical protein
MWCLICLNSDPPIPEGLLKVAEGKLTEYSATLTWRHPDACYEVGSIKYSHQYSLCLISDKLWS